MAVTTSEKYLLALDAPRSSRRRIFELGHTGLMTNEGGDELLKRLWQMPPKPHSKIKPKAKKKAKRKKKSAKKAG